MNYEELVASLHNCIDCLCGECKYQNLSKPGNFVPCMNKMIGNAADAIEELQKVANKLLAKYQEEATAVIWEYSGHIDESLDYLHEEIRALQAQIDSKPETPKEET